MKTLEAAAPAAVESAPQAGEGRRVLSNSLATLGGRALGTVFRFLATLIAASYLGPEAWGFFGVLVSTTEVVRAFTNFGLDTALVHWLTVHHEAAGNVLRRVLAMKTAFAAIGLAGTAAYGFAHHGASGGGWLLLGLSVGLFPYGWSQSLTSRFQALHSMHLLIPVQAAVGGIYLLAIYLACRVGVGVPGFIGLAVVYEFLVWGALVLTDRRFLPRAELAAAAPLSASALFIEGLPLGMMVTASVIYGRIGIFFLESEHRITELGHLYLAMRVTDYLVAVAGALAMSALPVFSRLAKEGKPQEIVPQFRRYSTLGVGFSITALVGVALVSRPVIQLVKPVYLPVYGPLLALVGAAVFMFQNQLSSGVLFAFGRFRLPALCAGMNLVVNLPLAWFLIPRYGATGAAIATLLTEGLNCLVQLVLVRTTLRAAARSA